MTKPIQATEQQTDEITELPLARAITEGLRAALAADERTLLFGEDVGRLGGVFTVTSGLQQTFGSRRVFDSPLSEAGIVGTAIGLALDGYRPIVEIQFDGFIFPGFDQITSQLAKQTNRHEGSASMPVVIRVPYGGGIGAIEHHQESPEGYFAHTPGLRVVSPSNPDDAYWMIQQAVASDDPVLFFEPKRRYWQKGPVRRSGPAAPLHTARVVRSGEDLTLIAHGSMVPVALDAAAVAAQQGVSLEVIDLRSISPLDMPTLIESVRRTRRAVVIAEAQRSFGITAEIAQRLTEACFDELRAPVGRVGAPDVPFPPAKLQGFYVPDVDRVLVAVDAALAH